MLYIDGFSLSMLKNELKENLVNRKVSKISQHDKNSFSLFFTKIPLYFSITPDLPIVFTANKKEEGDSLTTPFLLSLRKFLLNSLLIDVEQHSFDRILIFKFKRLNEIGEINDYNLIIEIMGKHSNIFITDSDFKIIDLMKKFSIDENKLRLLMPNAKYEFPVISKKLSPPEITKDFFENNIFSSKNIIEYIEGFGTVSANEIFNSFTAFSSFINSTPSPVIYFKNDKINIASFFVIPSFEVFPKKNFDTINDMINYYINETITSRSFNNLKIKLLKTVDEEIKKNYKIITFIEKDISKYSNFETYKETADIIAANLYSITSGISEIELFNFYTEKNILINFDKTKSSKENMDNYYKKYSKQKKGYEFSILRLENIKKEILYLESVMDSFENCSTLVDLKNIEEELAENNYLKIIVKGKQKQKKDELSIKEFTSSDDFKILAGKNNKENDFITFKIGDKTDIWLHAKNIPGSHVIIKSENRKITDTAILEAASIAAYFSKGKSDSLVPVDYTEKRYVKKPNGAKPGFVVYTNEKTIYVKPEIKISNLN